MGETPWQAGSPQAPQRRLIIDNDFAGDPDGLVQLAHHLLSPSADIRAIVASHLGPGAAGGIDLDDSAGANTVAENLFALMGLDSTDLIVRGAPRMLTAADTPAPSPAVSVILDEALREDTDTPLFYAAGGGLTDLASALLMHPEIAERITLVWIGGPEHEGLASPPPCASPFEYNLGIDLFAAQVVFSASGLRIWQVPRDAYRQCLISMAELRTRMGSAGALGAFLLEELEHERTQLLERGGREVGETYALGDSPLVLLTVLQSMFEPDSSSSAFATVPTPEITERGRYDTAAGARPMRVYTRLDTRLMFEDLFAKLGEFASWQSSS
ncbi:nucleoside hydrolase [Brachybacterium massiliense]|uniref:nucleoside hydrolase n=1 Tax=Brachybacterium massiliense TaxID=1755098 RepID=UPI001FE5AF27|nr:nucleoside hydrolase [Brachybacterium massiliense]